MSRRKAFALLAFVIVVVLGALAWRFLGESSAEGRHAAAAHATPNPAPTLAPAPTDAAAPSRAPSEEVRAERVPSIAPAKVGIDCSVVVVGQDSSEHAEEDGSLTPGLLTCAGDPALPQADVVAWTFTPLPKTAVTAGSFRVDVPDGASVGILDAELGGRPAHFDGPVAIQVVAGKENEFRLRWIEGIRLHVVDATTHAELDDVTVVARSRNGFLGLPPCAALVRNVVEHATSPIPIQPFSTADPRVDAKGQYYVVARGHAWARTEIWRFDRRDLTVALPAGAALDVDVTGELPIRDARASGRTDAIEDEVAQLRLRRSSDEEAVESSLQRIVAHYPTLDPASFPGGAKPTLEEFKKGLERFDYGGVPSRAQSLIGERPAALGTTHLEGLLPGRVDVSVELGEPMGRVFCAARASVELVAGETAHVTLNLKSVQFPRLVPVAGTLHVPAGWSTQDARLELLATDLDGEAERDRARLPLKEMTSVPGDPQTFRFDAGTLPAATYRFTIESLAFERELRIAAPDSDHVALAVPEAGTLDLTVVDATSGRPVDVRGVSWRPGTGAWSLVAPAIGFHPIEGGARLAATLPVGEGKFDLGLSSEWRLDPPASIVVHAGEQEFTLRVHHANGVRLKLESGGAVAWKDGMPYDVKFEPVDGDGVVTMANGFGATALFVVSRPGWYLVTLPAIAGYADVEPFKVEIPAGEYVEKTVELHRR